MLAITGVCGSRQIQTCDTCIVGEKLVRACATIVSDGMVVTTTEATNVARSEALAAF
jgi:predicted molibdopterin-dependent oxidoreductase YjgC